MQKVFVVVRYWRMAPYVTPKIYAVFASKDAAEQCAENAQKEAYCSENIWFKVEEHEVQA